MTAAHPAASDKAADLVEPRASRSARCSTSPGGVFRAPDPRGRSYQTYAWFSDPAGNGWLLQEIKTRLPSREWED